MSDDPIAAEARQIDLNRRAMRQAVPIEDDLVGRDARIALSGVALMSKVVGAC
jgi:hypothetical protein